MLQYDDQGMVQLKHLTGSGTRAKILFALKSNPQTLPELTRALSIPDTTISQSLRALVEDHAVEVRGKHNNSVYQLTNTGSIKVKLLESAAGTLAALEEYEQFWATHSLEGIPDGLQVCLGMLSGGQCIRDAPDSPMKSQRHSSRPSTEQRRCAAYRVLLSPVTQR
ncbi:ArsR family transcriptional regulator [Candidatus Pacearchaeota archaeon]|jgi:predicted transcriptional regulator|nr:ArsR family transcriptional regulator [Candidatus Pacearchaeota archaeon]